MSTRVRSRPSWVGERMNGISRRMDRDTISAVKRQFTCCAQVPPPASAAGHRWRDRIIGFLITHGESVSIPDYLSVSEGDTVRYRPTCHYAYHPCDDAVLSLHELQARIGNCSPISPADDGRNRLGHGRTRRLAYGKQQGSILVRVSPPIEEARRLRLIIMLRRCRLLHPSSPACLGYREPAARHR